MGCGGSSARGAAYAAPATPDAAAAQSPGPEPETLALCDLGPALLVQVCGWLPPGALGRLACASRRFRDVVEHASRQSVLAAPAEEQARAAAAWGGRSGCWLRRMHEIGSPLAFTRSHELVALSEGGGVATKAGHGDYTFRVAATAVPMVGGGRYHATFTVLKYVGYTLFGLIRPGFFVEGGAFAHDVEGHMFYSTGSGRRSPGPIETTAWEGMEDADEGDTIGLLLDLDEGTLSVYKNGERLGVMARELKGEYVWACSMGSEGDSCRIASAPMPP